MPKKAVLVNFSTWVRVVVDLPEGADPSDDQYFDTISEAAIKQFRKHVREDDDYPYPENIIEIEEDVELPYGEAPEDKETDEKEVELEIGKIYRFKAEEGIKKVFHGKRVKILEKLDDISYIGELIDKVRGFLPHTKITVLNINVEEVEMEQ